MAKRVKSHYRKGHYRKSRSGKKVWIPGTRINSFVRGKAKAVKRYVGSHVGRFRSRSSSGGSYFSGRKPSTASTSRASAHSGGNNGCTGCGCGLFIVLVVLGSVSSAIERNPWLGFPVILCAVIWLTFCRVSSKKTDARTGFCLIAWLVMLVSLGHLAESDSSNEDLYYTGFFIYLAVWWGLKKFRRAPAPSAQVSPAPAPVLKATGGGGHSPAPAPAPAWKPRPQPARQKPRSTGHPVPSGPPAVALPAPRIPKNRGPEGLLMSGVSTKANIPLMEDLQARINATPSGGTLQLDFHASFMGNFVISKPMTLDGMGKCLWATKGPVLQVLSSGVSLRNLGLEVVDGSNASHSDEKLALKAEPRDGTSCASVWVIGEISGLAGQEGDWGCPRMIDLGTLAARTKQIRTFDVHPPSACSLMCDLSGVRVSPTQAPGGPTRVELQIDPLSSGILLRGSVKITCSGVVRVIRIRGRVA